MRTNFATLFIISTAIFLSVESSTPSKKPWHKSLVKWGSLKNKQSSRADAPDESGGGPPFNPADHYNAMQYHTSGTGHTQDLSRIPQVDFGDRYHPSLHINTARTQNAHGIGDPSSEVYIQGSNPWNMEVFSPRSGNPHVTGGQPPINLEDKFSNLRVATGSRNIQETTQPSTGRLSKRFSFKNMPTFTPRVRNTYESSSQTTYNTGGSSHTPAEPPSSHSSNYGDEEDLVLAPEVGVDIPYNNEMIIGKDVNGKIKPYTRKNSIVTKHPLYFDEHTKQIVYEFKNIDDISWLQLVALWAATTNDPDQFNNSAAKAIAALIRMRVVKQKAADKTNQKADWLSILGHEFKPPTETFTPHPNTEATSDDFYTIRDFQGNANHDFQGNVNHDFQGNVNHGLQSNVNHGLQGNMGYNLQGNMGYNLQGNMGHNLQGNMGYNQWDQTNFANQGSSSEHTISRARLNLRDNLKSKRFSRKSQD